MLEFTNEHSDKKLSQSISLKYPTLGGGRIRALIKNKEVSVDGKRQKEDVRIEKGALVRVYCELPKKEWDVKIVYEDENMFVFNKPKGLETTGEYSLETFAKSICSTAVAVHRLDMNTDGVVMFAKNKKFEGLLINAIKERKITKNYIAVTYGKTPIEDTLRAYLKKDKEKARVTIYDNHVRGSLPIVTKYRALYYGNDYTVVEIDLVTGRTHQIRAQFAYIGHQVLGDGKYGRGDINSRFPYKKQALTAYKLTFNTDGELGYLNGKIIEIDCEVNKIII